MRWRHAIRNAVLPPPYEDPRIIGEGGFPVWNRSIFGQIYRSHETGIPIFLILPDFRFGNSLFEQKGFVLGQFYNGHSHVKKHLIRPDVDAVLYRQHVENLTIWRTVYGRDLSIFDWTQLMTASEHRWTDRYVDEGGNYENRAYAEWVGCDRNRLGARSWPEGLLLRENARLRRLIVDRSLHPSAIGFFLLHHRVHGDPFMTAMEKGEALWRRWLDLLAARLAPLLDRSGPVALGGDSIWFATAGRLLGTEGCALLRGIGLHVPEPEGDPRSLPRDLPSDALHAQITDVVDVSDAGIGSAPRPFRFQWGAFARNVVAARHPDNAHLAVPGIEGMAAAAPDAKPGQVWLARALASTSPESYVDAGSDLSPSFIGMAMVLLSVAEALAEARDRRAAGTQATREA